MVGGNYLMRDQLHSDKTRKRIESLSTQVEQMPAVPCRLNGGVTTHNARITAENFLNYAKHARDGRFLESCLNNVEQLLNAVK